MENNEYREHFQDEDLILEPERVFENEVTTEKELIPDKDEANVGVIISSNEENEAQNNKQQERDSQSQQSQSQGQTTSSTSASSSSVGSGAASSAGTTGASAAGATGGIACAAAAGVTLMVIMVSIMVNINVTLSKFDVFYDYVRYVINVKLEIKLDKDNPLDYKNLDTGLFLTVTSNNQKFVTKLTAADKKLEASYKIISITDETVNVEYDFRGEVEGLNEGESYSLEVFSDENGSRKTYYTQEFKTKTKQSQVNVVNIENNRQIDGNLYFQIDFVDDYNYFSNFNYMVIDETGLEGSIMSGSITYPHERQSINISDLKGKNYILIISYDSSAPKDASEPTIHIRTEFTV